jgi:hypothetical protein
MEKMKIGTHPFLNAALLACLCLCAGTAAAAEKTQGSWSGLSGAATSRFTSSVSRKDNSGKFAFVLSSKAMSLNLRTNDEGRLFYSEQINYDKKLIRSLGFDKKLISSIAGNKIVCELFREGKKKKTIRIAYKPDDLIAESLQFSLNDRLKGFLIKDKSGQVFSFKTYLVLSSMGLRLPVNVTLYRTKIWPKDMYTPVKMTAPPIEGDVWIFTVRITGVASIFASSAIYVAYRTDKRDELLALIYSSAKDGEGYIVD